MEFNNYRGSEAGWQESLKLTIIDVLYHATTSSSGLPAQKSKDNKKTTQKLSSFYIVNKAEIIFSDNRLLRLHSLLFLRKRKLLI